MQFSYKVSEADYLRAWKLRARRTAGNSTLKAVMFWMFILICLLMLWAVVQKSAGKGPGSSPPAHTHSSLADRPVQPDSTNSARAVVVNFGPFVLILGLWFYMRYRLGTGKVRKLYRNDPAMQGTFTVDITPSSLSMQNTAGISTQSNWSLYDYWKEVKGTMVLMNRSGAYFIIGVDTLSDPQRAELRGMLSSVLPTK